MEIELTMDITTSDSQPELCVWMSIHEHQLVFGVNTVFFANHDSVI